MKIQMIEQYSGGRYDGREWPPARTDFEVPEEEGRGLIRQGVAVEVKPPKSAKAATEPAPISEGEADVKLNSRAAKGTAGK